MVGEVSDTDRAVVPGPGSAEGVPADLKDLILGLLKPIPDERGVTPDGLSMLKVHAAFDGTEWEKIVSREATPPFVPGTEANVPASVHDVMDGASWEKPDPLSRFGVTVGRTIVVVDTLHSCVCRRTDCSSVCRMHTQTQGWTTARTKSPPSPKKSSSNSSTTSTTTAA